jgi:hypothetical protein
MNLSQCGNWLAQSDAKGQLRGFGRVPATSGMAPIAETCLHCSKLRDGSMLFSNSGSGCQALKNDPARPTVLSAVGACPPHDGVRRRWWINVARAVTLSGARKKSGDLTTATEHAHLITGLHDTGPHCRISDRRESVRSPLAKGPRRVAANRRWGPTADLNGEWPPYSITSSARPSPSDGTVRQTEPAGSPQNNEECSKLHRRHPAQTGKME